MTAQIYSRTAAVAAIVLSVALPGSGQTAPRPSEAADRPDQTMQHLLENSARHHHGKVALYAKDLRNVVKTLEDTSTAAPVTAIVHRLVSTLVRQNRGQRDCSELGKLVLEMAGLD